MGDGIPNSVGWVGGLILRNSINEINLHLCSGYPLILNYTVSQVTDVDLFFYKHNLRDLYQYLEQTL